MKANILLFDLETAPNRAYVWSLWNELKSMDFITSNWYVLCWAAKWLGDKEVMSSGIYSKSENDKSVMKKLWKLIDKADIVIAHNAIKFDCRRINTRFIANGMTSPSPYKVIDTLRVARSKFFFTSNRLNDLGEFLDVGKKIKTGGFELWKKCLDGDKEAWNKMVKYCENDVTLLEKVYLKLRPYISNHPNMGVYEDRPTCPNCASSNVNYRGYAYTNAGRYRRIVCKDCGAWGRDRKTNLTEKTLASA